VVVAADGEVGVVGRSNRPAGCLFLQCDVLQRVDEQAEKYGATAPGVASFFSAVPVCS